MANSKYGDFENYTAMKMLAEWNGLGPSACSWIPLYMGTRR
jgi:hypothetical protein